MILFLLSCIAGILTTLAPCTLPLLPIIIGGSVAEGSIVRTKAVTVIASLGISIILFTFLLKVSSVFIMVPPFIWAYLSGGIIIATGLSFLFPNLYGMLPGVSSINRASNKSLSVGYKRKNFVGDVLIGLSLGPIFSTCSPTFFIILATVLPASFTLGSIYLFGFVLGLCTTLLFVALLGQRLVSLLGAATDPRGLLKKSMGGVFLIVGLCIVFGFDITLEQRLSAHAFDITSIEQQLLHTLQ